MLGQQYEYMGRFYVAAGETFRGIVKEPVFLETTRDGRVLTLSPERIDGWYFGVPTGRRFGVPSPLPAMLPAARPAAARSGR
jgi:hypothetical protein